MLCVYMLLGGIAVHSASRLLLYLCACLFVVAERLQFTTLCLADTAAQVSLHTLCTPQYSIQPDFASKLLQLCSTFANHWQQVNP